MKSQDIAVVGILLAVGAIVRYLSLVIPGPIVSNLVIAFYCLAIILVVPTFKEVIGIGAVAGIVCALLSHSIFPPANLISEPVGAIGPFANGTTFVIVEMAMVAPAILSKFATMGAFVGAVIPIVVGTAIANAVIAQILYMPASKVLARGRA